MQNIKQEMELSTTIYKKGPERLPILIIKAYIFLLPFRMISPLLFTKQYLGVCANYFDLVLHLLGLLLIFIRSRGVIHIYKDKTSTLFHYFAWMIAWFNLSSFIMAFIMQNKHGNIGKDSAFHGIAGMLVYFTQYAFMVFYNKEIFKEISKEEIISILNKVINILLFIGYFQFIIINFGGIFATIYDNLDIFDIMHNSNMSKICLTTTEGASAGTLIASFVYPFYMSRIFVEKRKFKYLISLLAWLPIVYLTYSSNAYILIAIDVLVFSLIYIFKVRSNMKPMIICLLFSIAMIFGLTFSTVITNIVPDEVSANIQYLMFEKAIDKANGSTVSRTVPFYVNWGAFTEYPVFGVGNGNQGYFYEKYFPHYAYNVAGSDVRVFLERSRNEISNGGVFIPSLLSGYGIVGAILVLMYIIKCMYHANENRDNLGSFYYMFYISWAAIFVSGFQGDFTGEYYIWFLLSIPYIAASINQTNTQ